MGRLAMYIVLLCGLVGCRPLHGNKRDARSYEQGRKDLIAQINKGLGRTFMFRFDRCKELRKILRSVIDSIYMPMGHPTKWVYSRCTDYYIRKGGRKRGLYSGCECRTTDTLIFIATTPKNWKRGFIAIEVTLDSNLMVKDIGYTLPPVY